MIDLKKLEPLLNKLGKEGVFVTAGKKPNTMVASWGSVGVYWRKPVIIVPIRLSRYTRELIDTCGEFCISVPSENMQEALKICGSKSGKTCDKYAEAKITTKKCKQLSTSTINGCSLTIECKVIAEMEMEADTVSNEIYDTFYSDDDMHIMYYGEIVDIY